MSQNIRLHLFKASILMTTCNSSRKLTKALVEYWRDYVPLSLLGQRKKFLSIVDCWGGQGYGKGLYDHISRRTRLPTSRKTTDQIESLDVFFNGQMKVIPRRLYDRVLFDELDIKMSEHNNIICLTFLNYNQIQWRRLSKELLQNTC